MHGHKADNAKVKKLRYGSTPMLHIFIICDKLDTEKTQLQYTIDDKISGFFCTTPKFHL